MIFEAIDAADSINQREKELEQEFLREGESYARGYLSNYRGIKKIFAEFLAEMCPFPTRYVAAQEALVKMIKRK
jgi:hypothetical protein